MNQVTSLSSSTFNHHVIEAPVPVLVDYWAEWCAPCRTVRPVIAEAAGEYADRVRIAELNVDENCELAAHYGVRAIPTLMLFKGGRVVAQQTGAFTRAGLDAFLQRNL